MFARELHHSQIVILSEAKDLLFAARKPPAFFTETPSHRLSRAKSGRPGPLEVEAAELAGDVNHFTDEEKAGNFSRLHGRGGKFVSIDTTCRDFRFSVALGPFRFHFPPMQLTFGVGERAIGVAG